MLVIDRGQVTIPKHIRVAAGMAPGSEVAFSPEGGRIVMTPIGTGIKEDRRAKLRATAAKVWASLSPDFKQLKADEIMKFIRGDEVVPTGLRRGDSWSRGLRRQRRRIGRHPYLGRLHRCIQPLARMGDGAVADLQ